MNRFLLATAAVLTLTLNSLCVQSVGEKTGMIFVLGIAPTTADSSSDAARVRRGAPVAKIAGEIDGLLFSFYIERPEL